MATRTNATCITVERLQLDGPSEGMSAQLVVDLPFLGSCVVVDVIDRDAEKRLTAKDSHIAKAAALRPKLSNLL